MHISFSGVDDLQNAPQVRECAKLVPFDRMLVETDAPYLAPVPYRGKRNEPGYTRYVVETIAKERVLAWEEVAAQTTQNAIKLFRNGRKRLAMNPVIVVEGRDDTRRLREIYPDIETIETNGSAIDEETIALIQKALQTREVIVFTDPDYPGTRIRNIIQERVPGVNMLYRTCRSRQKRQS